MDAMLARERELIREALRDLPGRVTIRSYTSDVDSWHSRAERLLLESIAAASPQVTLEVLAGRWDARREEEAGISRTPAITLVGARDHGIRYYGLPDGYELPVFLDTIQAVAAARSGLGRLGAERVHTLHEARHLEVFASPT